MAVGDAVIAFVVPTGPRGGAYAEQIVVHDASVVPTPLGASFAEASTLLLNTTTARLSLDPLALPSGATVAVIGSAGAVGGYAIQLAKTDGLTLVAVAKATDDALVRSLGADVIVDPGEDVGAQIRGQLPSGAPGVIDGAALDGLALPAVTDGGGLVTLRGWTGPSERDIRILPISSFGSATDTALLDQLRSEAERGTLWLRVTAVLPAEKAARRTGGWPLEVSAAGSYWISLGRCPSLAELGSDETSDNSGR